MYRLFFNYKTQRFKIIQEEEPFSTFDDGMIVARSQSLEYLKGVCTGLIAGQKYAQREYEVTDVMKAIVRAEAETEGSMVSVLENLETDEVSTRLYASLENEFKHVDITQHTEMLLSIHKELCKNKKLSSFDIKGDSLLFVSNGVHFCATARTDVITAIDLHKDGSLIRTLFGVDPLIKMFSETDNANH